MAYIDHSNVEGEMKVTFSDSTTPTATRVDEICEEEQSIVDSKLKPFVTVPVTETAFLKVVKKITMLFVKFRIYEIMGIKSGSEQDQETPQNLKTEANDILNSLIENRDFYDATRNTANEYGLSDYNYTNSVEPEIDVTSDMW